jgi:tetratricopeptide (TPR) repeat protein
VFAVHRLTSLIALALLAACSQPPAPPVSRRARLSPAASSGAPGPKDSPGVQADGEVVSAVQWFEGSFEEAQAAAKASGKRLFVDVGAYWCPPCRQLDEQVFTQKEVGEALGRDYVALHIDAEKGEGPDFVARYRVQAYPTLLVLEAGGLEKGRLVDAMTPPSCSPRSGRSLAGGDVLAALEAAVQAKPDDLEARYRLGNAYALAARRAEAEAELARVIADDPDNARGLAAKAMADRAAFLVAKQDGDPERAIALYRELQQKFPTAKESLRAYPADRRELHKLGRDDEAVASLEAMVAAEPGNVDLKSAFGWFSFRERCRPEAGPARRSTPGSPSTRQRRSSLRARRAAPPARRRGRRARQHPRGGGDRAGVGLLQAAGPPLHRAGLGAGGRPARGDGGCVMSVLAHVSAGTAALTLASAPVAPRPLPESEIPAATTRRWTAP